jgi:hypothetical protein
MQLMSDTSVELGLRGDVDAYGPVTIAEVQVDRVPP